jgi:guanine deaminase
MPGSACSARARFSGIASISDDAELALLRDSRRRRGILPDPNLFIGSGLFDYRQLAGAGIRIALATDVGGGTSYSMLRTAEAYKVMQVQGQNPSGTHRIRS